MLIWYFSNNLDIYYNFEKLPEQHFRVWLFFNPGDKVLFLLKFNEARISEWNLCLCWKFLAQFWNFNEWHLHHLTLFQDQNFFLLAELAQGTPFGPATPSSFKAPNHLWTKISMLALSSHFYSCQCLASYSDVIGSSKEKVCHQQGYPIKDNVLYFRVMNRMPSTAPPCTAPSKYRFLDIQINQLELAFIE